MKNQFMTVKEIWKYFRKDKLLVFVSYGFAILCAFFLIGASVTTGMSLNAFDDFVNNGYIEQNSLHKSLIFAAVTIFIYLLYWGAQTVVYRIIIKLSHKAGSKIRAEVFKNLLRLPISYIDNKKTGEFISRTSNDVDQLVVSLTESLATTTVGPFIITIVTMTMLLISPYLTAIFIVMMPLVIVGGGLISAKAAPHFIKQQENLGALNGTGLELIENKDAIYFFQKQKKIYGKYKIVNNEYMENIRKGEYKIRLVWPWVDIIENSMYGVIFVIGAILYGQSSGTALGVFGIYDVIDFGLIATILSFARMINGEVGNFARQGPSIQKILACAKRTTDIINEKPEIDNGKLNTNNIQGNIEFKNVSFGYNPKNPVLKDFNLKIEKGTRVAIVGPTGCGKTTLSQLLLRFYDVDSGSIEIDGIDIRKFNKKSLSDLITIVSQDTHLFSVTIEDNIKYGTQKSIDHATVENAAKVMNSLHFINVMPDNFNTILKYSSSISTGQAQLLSLSRAYVNDSRILILDEATSSIDTKTEIEVQKGMLELMKGKTSFVIAHRLSTIINSDLIIVMKNGEIVEQGKHQELLANKNFYYQLYNAKIEL